MLPAALCRLGPSLHAMTLKKCGLQGLPHPSWRQAVGGVPERDGRALPDAAAFWAALGL